MPSRMLDWKDKTNKTVYFLSKSLRFMAFSTTQSQPVSHGYNHKAGLVSRVGHIRLTQT